MAKRKFNWKQTEMFVSEENQSCGFRSDQVDHATPLSTDNNPNPTAKLPAEGVGVTQLQEFQIPTRIYYEYPKTST